MSAAPIIAGTPEWHDARSRTITATKIAAIVGLHPYITAHQVYLSLTGQASDPKPNEAMQTGTDLEPYIAAVFRKRFGVETAQAYFCTHPDHPELGCTPDYYIGDDTVLEIKWVGQHAAQNFGDEGTDDIPAHYLCQVNWQCFITGRGKWILYVLGPWGFRRYEGKHNTEFTRRLAFQALKFWGEYVVSDCPPPLSGHQPDTAYVSLRNPLDDGSIVQASEEIEYEIADLGNNLQLLDDLTLKVECSKNRIKDFMGSAQILKSDSGTFTWKNSKDREKTDHAAIVAVLAERLNLSAEDLGALVAAHTTTKEGPRVFRTPFSTNKA